MADDTTQTEFYANAVNVIASLYDVTLSFRAEIPVAADQTGKPILQASGVFNIRMSPQHAKALAALLTNQVLDYEKNFNVELPIEDRLAEMWKQNLKESK